MAIISLGTVTIVGMSLWFLASLFGRFVPMKGAKAGILVSYLVAVLWTAGVL